MSERIMLSDDAERLLKMLRDRARHRCDARTDKELALWLALNPRTIIDLAEELLDHGLAVIAATADPPGRWLLTEEATDEEFAEAHRYPDGLDHRGKSILLRAKKTRGAIGRVEAKRKTETNGQQRLFTEEDANNHASASFASALQREHW